VSADVRAALVGRRPAHLRGRGRDATPCYARDRFAPGMAFEGPALVDQPDATSLVAPGFRARVDAALNLVLERA
jgi:N-methylhydantoinase A